MGFNFGSQDKGLADSIKTTTTGLSQIGLGIAQISMSSAKMAFKPPNLGPAIGQATALASDMKLTTTNIEAFGVASNKVTSAGLAGLNMTEKELRRAQKSITSGSFAMNIGAEGMTQSLVALKQAGVDIEKVGFTGGLQEFQKFVEVTGADSTKLASALGVMGKQMKFSDKQTEETLKSVAAIGKKFNIGREAVAGMSETVSMLNEQGNLFTKNWSPERSARFIKGTTTMAGAMASLGFSAEDAMAGSRGLTKALLAGETGMKSLYSGLSTDIPDGMNVLTQHLGSIPEAMNMMAESPDQFMLKMGGLVDQVKGMNLDSNAMDRFNQQMAATFGPEVQALLNQGLDKVGPAINEANDPIEGQAEVLQTLAKRYKDGRTMAERFAIAQDRLVTTMKGVTGVMSDQAYLKKYKQNTKELAAQLETVAAKGGPLGTFTQRLIEARVHGIGGMLASHTKYGMAISELSNQFAPILKVMPGIVAAFGALASPLVLVTAAVAGLYFVFKDLAKGSNSIVQPWIDKLKGELPKIMETVENVFSKAMSIIGPVITRIVDSIPWGKVAELLGKGLSFAAQLSLKLFESVLNIGGKILSALGGIDWNGVGATLGKYLGQAGLIAMAAVWKIFLHLPEIIYKSVKGALGLIVGLVDGIVEAIHTKFPLLGNVIKVVVMAVKGLLIGLTLLTLYVVATMIPAFISAGISMAASMVPFIVAAAPVIAVIAAIGIAIYGLYKAAEYVYDNIGAIASGIGDFFSDLIGGGAKQAELDVEAMARNSAIALEKAHREAVASAAKGIGSIEQLASVTDMEVKALVDSQIASGEKVVTTTGKIIAAGDAIYKWAKNAKGEIVRVHVALADMNLAVVNIESWQSATAAVDKVRKAVDTYGMSSKEAGEATAEWVKYNREFTKTHGYSAEKAAEFNKVIGQQLAIGDDLMASVGKYNAAYASDLQTRINEQATLIGQETADIMTHHDLRLAAMEAAGKKGTVAYQIELDARATAMDAQNVRMKNAALAIEDEASLITGSIGAMLKSVEGNADKSMSLASRASRTWSNSTLNAATRTMDGLKNIQGKERDMVLEKIKIIANLQESATNEAIANRGNKTAAALDAEVAAIRTKYEGLSKDVTRIAGENSENLALGLSEGFDRGMVGVVAKAKADGITLETEAAERGGQIVKAMGVSSKVAAGMVDSISNINPRDFKRNLEAVERGMKKFMGTFIKQATEMMDGLADSVNSVWDEMTKGLATQETLTAQWSDKAEQHIKDYWYVSVSEAGRAVVAFIGFVASMQGKFVALAQSINLMDLLASPSQIDLWASRVVSALAVAFKGGKAADAMIGAAYNKALAMSAVVGSASASPEGGSSSGGGLAQAASENLRSTINNPDWAEEGALIPGYLRDINMSIQTLASAMSSGGEMTLPPKSTDKTPRRNKRTQ